MKGSTGANGTSGTSGVKGNTGNTGATGPQGSAGANGTSGTSGVKGNTGNTGATGPQGVKGDAGNTGSAFPVYLNGKDNKEDPIIVKSMNIVTIVEKGETPYMGLELSDGGRFCFELIPCPRSRVPDLGDKIL